MNVSLDGIAACGSCYDSVPTGTQSGTWLRPAAQYEYLGRCAARAATNDQRREIVSRIAEDLIRHWLATYFKLSASRALCYDVRNDLGAKEAHRFTEIDAVSETDDEDPEAFFEIKFTGRRNSKSDARRQIRNKLEIAHERWPNVQGCVIIVSTKQNGPHSSSTDLIDHAMRLNVSVLQMLWRYGQVPNIVLSIYDLWRYARDLGIRLSHKLLQMIKNGSDSELN